MELFFFISETSVIGLLWEALVVGMESFFQALNYRPVLVLYSDKYCDVESPNATQ
jgi:hypothetical protein